MLDERSPESLDIIVRDSEPHAVDLAVQSTSSTNVPEHFRCKNRLQEYAQRSGIPLPVYQTINEGAQHAPKFRSTVFVDGTYITSPNTFTQRKAAEQDVATLALATLTQKIKAEGYPIIQEDTVFCKSILNEYAVKMNLEKPTYTTIQSKGLLPIFTSSLVFNGVNYTGESGRNKKEAEQLAARAVILSIFGNSELGTVISEIIKSKFKLYAALHKFKDSYGNQNGNTPFAANTGTGFGPPSGNEKEVEITGNGNTRFPVNTGTGFGPPSGNEKEVGITGNGNTPFSVNTGTGFGPSSGNEKEVEITGDGNTLLVVNTGPVFGFPSGHAKEVESTGGANNMPSTTISEVCSEHLNNTPASHQPFHEFKKPKWEQSSAAFTGIAFVPPATEQPLGAGLSSARKRNLRNRKNKKMKKVQGNATHLKDQLIQETNPTVHQQGGPNTGIHNARVGVEPLTTGILRPLSSWLPFDLLQVVPLSQVDPRSVAR